MAAEADVILLLNLMPELLIGEAPGLQRAWQHLLPGLGNATLDVNGGDFSDVLLINETSEQGPRLVVKTYRSHPVSSAQFEARIVAELETYPDPPIDIPRFINCHVQDGFAYTLFEYVEGDVLGDDEIRLFSADEKRRLGRSIGEFIIWMSKAMSPETYESIRFYSSDIIADGSRWNMADREQQFHESVLLGRAGSWLGLEIREPLADVLRSTWQMYKDLHAAGALRPTYVGHDDLYPGNMTIKNKKGARSLRGILDFGLTKPTSLERDLRYLLPLGSEIAEGAIEAYERGSGLKVRRDALTFWAAAQAISGYITATNPYSLASRLTDLRVLFPDRDWSGLEGRL